MMLKISDLFASDLESRIVFIYCKMNLKIPANPWLVTWLEFLFFLDQFAAVNS